MQDFAYHAPPTVAEAIALFAADPEGSRYLAGGTDLFLALEHGSSTVRRVIDLKAISGLDGIAEQPDGGHRLGALLPMDELMRNGVIRANYRALAESAEVVGGPPIRNRATLGGNLCNASPAADTAVPLVAFMAMAVLSSASGGRAIPVVRLWEAPGRTVLRPGELMTAIELPPPLPASASTFERLTRSAMDIALLSASAVISLNDDGTCRLVTLALGAVAPTVISIPEAGEVLRDTNCDDAALARVVRAVIETVRPIDDIRASAEYRREMAGVLAKRALARAYAIAIEPAGITR